MIFLSKFNLYPAVDILDGKCVRLLQGDYNFISTYYDDPLEPALLWQEAGSEWLHIIDLDGAKSGQPVNADLIRQIAQKTDLKIQIGGGIRSQETAQAYLDAGVARLIIGSQALKDPAFAASLVSAFGPEKIVVSVDGKENRALSQGWLEDSGKSLTGITQELVAHGVTNFIFTDTGKDGTLQGPNFDMALELAALTPNGLIIAGGIGNEDHIRQAAQLKDKGINGVIIGRALYTDDIDLKKMIEELEK